MKNGKKWKYIDISKCKDKIISLPIIEKIIFWLGKLNTLQLKSRKTKNINKLWIEKSLLPYIKIVETISTSNIEGSPMTIEEFLKNENNDELTLENKFSNYFKEAKNSINAYNKIFGKIESDKFINTNTLKFIHKNLFQNLNNESVKGVIGELKKTNNTIYNNITKEIIFEPCPLSLLNEELNKFDNFINKKKKNFLMQYLI